MKHARTRMMLAVLLAMLALGVLPAAALAILPASIAPSYSGTAYAIAVAGTSATPAPAGTVQFWRWTSSGWAVAYVTPGQSFHVQPWGSGWSWAYREGSWYAARTNQLAPWTCQAASGGARALAFGGDAYRYNNAMTRITSLASGTNVWPICEDHTADALGADTIGPCACYVPISYQLSWIWLGGRWSKVYINERSDPRMA